MAAEMSSSDKKQVRGLVVRMLDEDMAATSNGAMPDVLHSHIQARAARSWDHAAWAAWRGGGTR